MWDGNQPDNHNDGEDCAEIRTNGKWNDLPCTGGRAYICERPNGKVEVFFLLLFFFG